MSTKRIIDTSFWTDDKVVDKFTPEDKLFFLYLMTNPHSKQLGIYQINKRYMAFELGYSSEIIDTLINKFERKYGLIVYSNETGEIAIKNYLKHSIVKGGKPVEDLLNKEISEVKDKALIEYIRENLIEEPNLNESVKKIISNLPIYNNKYNNINVNVNVNVNDVSYHDSYHDSSIESLRKEEKKDTVKDTFCEEVIGKYNAICTSLPKALRVTEERKKAIKKLQKEKYTLDDFVSVFTNAESSDFLCCRNQREGATFKADFDWIISAKGKFQKILEGGYANSSVPSKLNKNSMFYRLEEGEEIQTGVITEW